MPRTSLEPICRADDRPGASPANPGLRLDEGAWTDHKPRPIPLHWFATEECEFLGALDDDEREALLTFWKATKMLGRA